MVPRKAFRCSNNSALIVLKEQKLPPIAASHYSKLPYPTLAAHPDLHRQKRRRPGKTAAANVRQRCSPRSTRVRPPSDDTCRAARLLNREEPADPGHGAGGRPRLQSGSQPS
jgi:hypothetical protein